MILTTTKIVYAFQWNIQNIITMGINYWTRQQLATLTAIKRIHDFENPHLEEGKIHALNGLNLWEK